MMARGAYVILEIKRLKSLHWKSLEGGSTYRSIMPAQRII